MGKQRWGWNYTHTAATYEFTSLPAAHKNREITRRGVNLDRSNVADIVPSVK